MGRTPHILIVEDDRMTRQGLGEYLSSKGYRISLAENGIEGLRVLEKGGIDLVITDYAMPVMDGEELILQMRKTYRNLPVILVSGFERREVKCFESIKDQLHDFFQKPINLALLQSSIQKAPLGIFYE